MFGSKFPSLLYGLRYLEPDGDGGGGSGGQGGGDGSQGGQDANAGGQQGGDGGQGNQDGKQGDGQSGATFTQEDVNRLVGAARAEGRKAAEEAAKKKADEDAAKAKGEWEKVANDRQAEIDRLTAELATRDRQALVAKVAAAHKLPDDLAELLKGDDEAALTEHAKRLAKHVKPAAAPDTEGGAGSRGGASRPAAVAATKKGDGATPSYRFIPAGAVPIPD